VQCKRFSDPTAPSCLCGGGGAILEIKSSIVLKMALS
jgi:hypothetical protein